MCAAGGAVVTHAKSDGQAEVALIFGYFDSFDRFPRSLEEDASTRREAYACASGCPVHSRPRRSCRATVKGPGSVFV
jgi:hypothetical protein